MHVVIVGCGRVGSSLAHELLETGHSVAIIDRRSAAFIRLDDDFAGQKVIGIGFDRNVLIRAGIESADAVAAVTSGDNSNILVARVARENFGIERVGRADLRPQAGRDLRAARDLDGCHRVVDHGARAPPTPPSRSRGRMDRSDCEGLARRTADRLEDRRQALLGHRVDREDQVGRRLAARCC